MAVRFVVARAGVGKTWHCLEAVRSRLRESAAEGSRLVLLVPEQAALQTERALIETPDVPGFARCEVLSFRRLAFRVLSGVGGTGRREVSGLSRLMVLRHLLSRRKRSLRVFGRVCDRRGFVTGLAAQLGELFYQGVAPDDFARLAAEPGGAGASLADKLHDLSLLHADYLAYLAGDRVDADQYLDLARERLDEATWLHGAEVWADGFAIFSRQEERLLAALARVAGQVEITLLADPSSPAVHADGAPGPTTGLFVQVEETVARLRDALAEARVEVQAPLVLTAPVPPRFAKAPALARLEEQLFRARPIDLEARPACDEADAGVAADATVRVFEAATRRVEVDRCVAEIQRLVQRREDPLRYRDIAVIVRQMDVYADLLSAALDAHEIAYFIDRRRSMAHHPLIELVRAVPLACADDMAAATVRLLLKTGLTGLTWDEADRLENYVLAYGIRSRRQWLGEPWTFQRRTARRRSGDAEGDSGWPASSEVGDANPDGFVSPTAKAMGHPDSVSANDPALAAVNAARDRLAGTLRDLLETSRGRAERTGRAWATALYAVLDTMQVAHQLEAWARSAESDGHLDEADEHRQVWRDVMSLLDEFVAALGDEPMSVRQFGQIIETGLEQFTLGLAPPSLDQVLVGSIERSRHPDIRAALVLGFNEGQFPSVSSDRGVLTDEENEWLRERGVRLGRGREMSLAQERLLAYIAVTRPRELLRISYAAADEDSKALTPSPYLAYVLGAFDDVVVESVALHDDGPDLWSIGRPAALAGRLAIELARRRRDDAPPAAARARWNALYEWGRRETGCPGVLRRALASLSVREQPRLAAPAVEALYGGDRRWSVSELETAAWCPFQHFVRYGLRLAERKEFAFGAVELGTMHHAILESLVRGLLADGVTLPDLDDEALSARLAAATEEQTKQLAQELALEQARQSHRLSRSLHDLRCAASAQCRVSAAGRFRPVATEVPFGYDDRDDSLPALEVDTPGGRRVRLRGYVDRVDVALDAAGALGMIVDYKRSRPRPLNLSKVQAGLELQLLTYLLVLAEHGDKLPEHPAVTAGAFYFNIKPQYERVDHPDDAKDPAIPTAYRPRGLFGFDCIDAFDAGLTPGRSSQVVQARLNKDGTPGNPGASDGATREQVQALLAEARKQIGRLADEILDGRIAVFPARVHDRLPCGWCPYAGVCRFEPTSGAARPIESRPRKQVLAALAQ